MSIKAIKYYIKKPKKIVDFFISRGFFNWLSDEYFLYVIFRNKVGYKLNLNNPKTINEKMQWLKLNDRNPLYTQLVDKYEVKKYISELIGGKYVVPTIGVYNSFDEIDFDELPNKFVLKCTHDSGGLCVCRDKSKLNIKKIKNKIDKSMKRDYWCFTREWQYKNVKPRIIVEEILENKDNTKQLEEYDIFCFNGIPKMIMKCVGDRDKGEQRYNSFYNINNELLPFRWGFPSMNIYGNEKLDEPKIKEMINISKKISKNSKFMRVDLHKCNDKIYFNEITFFHWAGLMKFDNRDWDYIIGDYLEL